MNCVLPLLALGHTLRPALPLPAPQLFSGRARPPSCCDAADAPPTEPPPEQPPPTPTTPADDPVFPGWGAARIPGSPTYDAVLAALPPADDADAMAAFVQANRDLLDYRFLYRMTAQLLSVENRGGSAATLRAQREGVVRAAQRFDAPLFKQIAEAEGRLGQLLAQNMQAAGKKGKKKRSDAASVVLAAGGQPIQIFAFWLVVVAAMAAWESKLATPSTSAMAQAKIAELAEVRDALEGRDSLVEAGALGELLPLLQLADVRSGVSGPAYRPPDSLAQLVAETLPKGEEDSLKVVRRLGCLSCQLQRHAFQAYNPLVQKATALYDVLQYGAPQPFVAPRTAPADAVPPEPNPTSNLIRLAYDADSLELPPQIFW